MQIPGLVGLEVLAVAGSSAVRAASQVAGGFGERLRAALTPETPAEPAGAPAATGVPREATTKLSGAVRALRARIRGALAAEGITLTEPLALVQDQFDRLRVVGEHPQREQIESLLASEPEIGDAFRELAAALLQEQSSGDLGPAPNPDAPIAYEREGKPTFELTFESPSTGDHAFARPSLL